MTIDEENMKKLTELAVKIANGETDKPAVATFTDRKTMVKTALAEGPESIRDLGASVAADLRDSMARISITMRMLENRWTGQPSRVRKLKDGTSTPVTLKSVEVSEFFPVYESETDDVLAQTLDDALALFLNREETTFLDMLRESAAAHSTRHVYKRPVITPACVSAMQCKIIESSLPAVEWLIPSQIIAQIQTGAFLSWFDPVSKLEIVRTGSLGSLLGMAVYSDAFRMPRFRVLKNEELFMVTDPKLLGFFMDNGGVRLVDNLPEDEGKVGFRLAYSATIGLYDHGVASVVHGVRETEDEYRNRRRSERRADMLNTYVAQAGKRPQHGPEVFVANTKAGDQLYVRDNGVGGLTYLSNSVGAGGVVVWDTSLASWDELMLASEHYEKHLFDHKKDVLKA